MSRINTVCQNRWLLKSDSDRDPHATLEGQVQQKCTDGWGRTKPDSDRAMLSLWRHNLSPLQSHPLLPANRTTEPQQSSARLLRVLEGRSCQEPGKPAIMVMKSVSGQKIRGNMPNSFGIPFVFRLESKGLPKQNVPCNFSKLGIKTISCFKLLPSIRFFFFQTAVQIQTKQICCLARQ